MAEFPEYEVGQTVHIVKFPMDGSVDGTRECDAGWAPEMSKYCGWEAVILCTPGEERYEIDIDCRRFWWSPDCFQESYGPYVDDVFPEDKEVDLAMEALFEGFCF